MTEAEHVEAIRNARRGTISDFIDATVAAVSEGYSNLPNDTMTLCWARRVVELEAKMNEGYLRGLNDARRSYA